MQPPLGSARLSCSQTKVRPGKLTWASPEQAPSARVCQCSCRRGLPSTGPGCLPASRVNTVTEMDRVKGGIAMQQRPWQDAAVRQSSASSKIWLTRKSLELNSHNIGCAEVV